MKTALLIFLVTIINCSLLAQSRDNYRTRNHKLNRDYKKEINSEKHSFATYKSVDENDELKRTSNFPRSEKPRQLTVKSSTYAKGIVENKPLIDQETTITGNNKKNGKRLLNFFAMVLALSLIITNE